MLNGISLCARCWPNLGPSLPTSIVKPLKLEGKIDHDDLFFKDNSALSSTPVPMGSLSANSQGNPQRPVSRAVYNSALVGDVEPDGWEEPALGCEATRAQRADDAGDLRGVARRHDGVVPRRDNTSDGGTVIGRSNRVQSGDPDSRHIDTAGSHGSFDSGSWTHRDQ